MEKVSGCVSRVDRSKPGDHHAETGGTDERPGRPAALERHGDDHGGLGGGWHPGSYVVSVGWVPASDKPVGRRRRSIIPRPHRIAGWRVTVPWATRKVHSSYVSEDGPVS